MPRSPPPPPLLLLLLLLLWAPHARAAAAAESGPRASSYRTCRACVDAGFGWSTKRSKCGGFPTRVCPDGAPPAASQPEEAPPGTEASALHATLTDEKLGDDDDLLALMGVGPKCHDMSKSHRRLPPLATRMHMPAPRLHCHTLAATQPLSLPLECRHWRFELALGDWPAARRCAG